MPSTESFFNKLVLTIWNHDDEVVQVLIYVNYFCWVGGIEPCFS